MRVRDDGRMGIGYNGPSYGRTINIGGSGMNFYTANEVAFGGAIFPTDTSLILWSNSNANNYLVLHDRHLFVEVLEVGFCPFGKALRTPRHSLLLRRPPNATRLS